MIAVKMMFVGAMAKKKIWGQLAKPSFFRNISTGLFLRLRRWLFTIGYWPDNVGLSVCLSVCMSLWVTSSQHILNISRSLHQRKPTSACIWRPLP